MDKVLIVVGDTQFLDTLKEGLQKYQGQFEILTASEGEKALQVLKKARISVMVIDFELPDMDGQNLLAHMKKNRPQVPCIVMAADEHPEAHNGTALGTFYFLKKPFDFSELANAIIAGLDRIDEGIFWKEHRK